MTAAAQPRPASGLGWYVYGVVAAGAPLPRVSGLGSEVEAFPAGPVAALVSRVDLAEFGEEPVRARLEDPRWLEQSARAHETVLEAALRDGAVVPFRFLTLYADESELRRFLTDHGEELRGVLERVRGKVELGVKAFVDRDLLERSVAQESAAVAELDAEIEGAAAGRAYLLARRRDQIARDEYARVLETWVAGAHARLGGAALEAVANPVQPPELSGRAEQMALNGAYLVMAGDDALAREVAELHAEGARLGITLELTGPWPPHNFVPRDLGS